MDEDLIADFKQLMTATLAQYAAQINDRFDSIDSRFDAIDRRFVAIDHRFDTMDNKIGSIKTEILEVVGEVIITSNDAVEADIIDLKRRVAKLEAKAA